MSLHQISQLRAALDALSRGDLEALSAHWHEECTFHFPGSTRLGRVYEGRDEVDRCFWMLKQLMPDLTIEVTNAFDGDDVVAVEWVKRSTTPDGTPFENRGVTIAEFRDGLVVAIRDHLDTEKLAAVAAPRKRPTRRIPA